MKITEINKLGKELELYTSLDYVGKGFPIIMPNGSKIIKIIRNYVEWVEEQNGYKNVRTPSISNSEIYKIADRYNEEKSRYFIVENSNNLLNDNANGVQNEIVLKPDVQPFHCSIYKMTQHSYKELPVKYCETSTVFRNERDIKGIMRTRQITLSDASIFCEFKNIKNEIKSSIMLQKEITQKLGIELNYVISTWDDNSKENYIGQVNEWNSCYIAMKDVLDELNVEYKIDQNAKMYGPSVKSYYNGTEFSVLQIDFEMTHRFELKYKNNKNEDETPIYIHHTLIGSYENLLNVLIERYEGFFPFVIAPVQVKIIADDEIYNDYSEKILKLLLDNRIRAEIDNSKSNSNEKFDKNLSMRIPYIVKIGKQEMNSETLMVTKVLEYEKQEKNIESNNKIEDEKSEIKYITKSYKIKEFLGEVTSCQTKF